MAECSASECGISQGKEQYVKKARGRPRKRPVKEVEPFEEEVLIEGAAASLSSCNQLHKLEKPVCSLQIPNNLLLKWQATPRFYLAFFSMHSCAIKSRSGSGLGTSLALFPVLSFLYMVKSMDNNLFNSNPIISLA